MQRVEAAPYQAAAAQSDSHQRSATSAARICGEALVAWTAQRCAFAVVFVAAALVFQTPGHSPAGAALSPHSIDNPWLNWWDSGHFFSVALNGYVTQRDVVFDALYSLTTRLVSVVTAGNVVVAAALVSNAACLAALALFRYLAELVLGARRARWALAFFAFQPGAIYLAITYSESLYLSFAIVAFIGLQRWNWSRTLVGTVLAALTRSVGLLLTVPAAVEAARQWRRERKLRTLKSAAAAIIAPLAVFLLVSVTLTKLAGISPLAAERAYFTRYVDWPWVGPAQAIGVMLHPSSAGANWNAAYDLGITAMMAILVALLVVQRQMRWTFGVYAVAGFIGLLSLPMHGPTVGEDLNGLPRYLMALFPVWLGLALWTGERRWRRSAASTLCLIGFGVSVFFLGHPPLVM